MSAGTRLYTPELLNLAVRLSDFPWNPDFPLQGDARSPSCGSTLRLGFSCDETGRIVRIGLNVHACAVGQAAAAIFADGVIGTDSALIVQAEKALALWLRGQGEMPVWPGMEVLVPAIDYPGRHGAIMPPWKAAIPALHQGV